MPILTTAEVLDEVAKSDVGFGYFKYVRVRGAFRFSDVRAMLQHRELISADEKPESAGIVEVRKDCFRFKDFGSVSLGIEWKEEDAALFADALGRPWQRPAPKWWTEDPEKSWQEFMELQDECSKLGRVCSNVEFQRDWVRGHEFSDNARTEGLAWIPGFPGLPHPEHADDCDAKLPLWNNWILWLRRLAQNAMDRGEKP